MSIIVLAWGSLIWDPRSLAISDSSEASWRGPGPELPIEFSRISADGRLTLVVSPEARPIPTLWKVMNIDSLSEAISNLASRENAVSEHIGYVDLKEKQFRDSHGGLVVSSIHRWIKNFEGDLDGHTCEAVIWTDLPSTFKKITGEKLSSESALRYLNGLDEESFNRAKEYIIKAPESSQTGLRAEIISAFDSISS